MRAFLMYFFFFKQKTAYEMELYWSSDVCSSDLGEGNARRPVDGQLAGARPGADRIRRRAAQRGFEAEQGGHLTIPWQSLRHVLHGRFRFGCFHRSEERSCRERWVIRVVAVC